MTRYRIDKSPTGVASDSLKLGIRSVKADRWWWGSDRNQSEGQLPWLHSACDRGQTDPVL